MKLRDAASWLPNHLDRVLRLGHDVHAYFNNDHQGQAVTDTTWLRERLGLPLRR